jgi:hypothetical protein
MSMDVASPIEGVTFPNTVFLGRKFGPSRTRDGDVLDITPFMKVSLLKFFSTTTSPSVVVFASRRLYACASGALQHEAEDVASGDVARQ